MITVHHLNDSRSQRILWLLEELDIDYEVVNYQRDATTRLAPSELKNIHPLGKSPVIMDGDISIHESGAITDYLRHVAERRFHTYLAEFPEVVNSRRKQGRRNTKNMWNGCIMRKVRQCSPYCFGYIPHDLVTRPRR